MKERIEYLDIAKGIGIILVVLGHVIPRGITWALIYNFHMPFFIFCSGIFFNESKSIKKIFKIAFDYLTLSLSCVFLWFLLFEDITYIKQSIFNILLGGISPYHSIYPVEALWYLPCLILIILEYHFISKIKNLYLRLAIIISMAIIGLVLLNLHNTVSLYYNIDISLVLLPFYYVGNILAKHSTLFKFKFSTKVILPPFLVGIAIYSFASIFNGNVNIFKAFYGRSYILYYFAAFLGIALFLLLSNFMNKKLHFISIPLTFIGKHTLVIMATHQLFINIIKHIFENSPSYNIIAFAVSMICSLLCSIIYNKFEKILWRKKHAN